VDYRAERTDIIGVVNVIMKPVFVVCYVKISILKGFTRKKIHNKYFNTSKVLFWGKKSFPYVE
jgi:hypothetical protein